MGCGLDQVRGCCFGEPRFRHALSSWSLEVGIGSDPCVEHSTSFGQASWDASSSFKYACPVVPSDPCGRGILLAWTKMNLRAVLRFVVMGTNLILVGAVLIGSFCVFVMYLQLHTHLHAQLRTCSHMLGM